MDIQLLYLKKGKEKLAARRHPWVFDGALDLKRENPDAPCVVELRDHKDNFVAIGTYNPKSTIAVRLFRFDNGPLDEEFFTDRFDQAKTLRSQFINSDNTNGFRLIHGEGDGLSGLVVDTFDGHLVVQVGTPGLLLLQNHWMPALESVFRPWSITGKPDRGAANREKFEPPEGSLKGNPPEEIQIKENGVRFDVVLSKSQKTGFFFDQRDNRLRLAGLCSNKRVLDAFCYHGAFAITALCHGAKEAVAVDSSQDAIDTTIHNATTNGVELKLRAQKSECHEYLRNGTKDFDVVVVDPPALAKRKSHVDKAARAYKDLFLHGVNRAVKTGYVMLCSCSSAVNRSLFDKIVAGAVQDSRREATIIDRTGAGADHPVSVYHPEGAYLKTTLLRISN